MREFASLYHGPRETQVKAQLQIQESRLNQLLGVLRAKLDALAPPPPTATSTSTSKADTTKTQVKKELAPLTLTKPADKPKKELKDNPFLDAFIRLNKKTWPITDGMRVSSLSS